MTNEAKEYFKKYVDPGLDEWNKNRQDERLAMNLANSLNNLVEYYWHTFSKSDPVKVLYSQSLNDFRVELAKGNQNIGLIRDMADAHKHLKLSRPDRAITNANQVEKQNVGYGQAYGLCYGGGELLAIVMDDGNEKYFQVIVESAYEFWKTQLN